MPMPHYSGIRYEDFINGGTNKVSDAVNQHTFKPDVALLDGVRVIDLTHYISGPYCTKLLATLGAEVIKIERPVTGDPLRRSGPFASSGNQSMPHEGGADETGAWFLYLNTSKKSVTLDLKSQAGREVLIRLASSAQIVVESFAPCLGLKVQRYALLGASLDLSYPSQPGGDVVAVGSGHADRMHRQALSLD